MSNFSSLSSLRQKLGQPVLMTLVSSVSTAVAAVRHYFRKGIWTAMQAFARAIFLRAAPMLSNFAGHLELARVLASPHTIELTRRHPKLAYKYLGGNYLAKSFSTKTRLAILTNHYSYLKKYVTDDFLKLIFDMKVVMWRECGEGEAGESEVSEVFAVTLSFPHSVIHRNREDDHEGDMLLIFEVNSVPVYVASFTIVQGTALNIVSEQALFVSRIQGMGGHSELIRNATKALYKTHPSTLLLAATQAIALALHIDTIVGVSSEDQISNVPQTLASQFSFDYDKFWMDMHAERNVGNFYVLPIPFPEKPIELFKRHHRKGILRKRKFKDDLVAQVRRNFEENYVRKP